MTKRIAIVVLVLVVAGCAGPSPSSTPSASLAPGTLALPVVDHLDEACGGVGLEEARLTGDPGDPRVAWVVQVGRGRLDVVFPPGFVARFVPQLEVLDGSGQVVAREGSPIDGGCVVGEGGAPLLVLWP